MNASELRFLKRLLLSYFCPFWDSKTRISVATLVVIFWSPSFFELPFVCLIFTSHVALQFFHVVGF